MSKRRIDIKWTDAARDGLKRLPLKVRQGLLAKADNLYNCADPRTPHKPLMGPLQGCYRIAYSRYRAIYRVEEETIANGDVLVVITIIFIAVGTRKEHDKNDIYRVVQKLVDLGALDATNVGDDSDDDT